MSYKQLSNINYLADTEHGTNYKMAITNCRLPNLPDIEYIDYKEVLLNRIKFMIGLLGKTHSEAIAQLNKNGVPIMHSAKFLKLPEENAAEYTSTICRTITGMLKDNVIKKLTVAIIKECVMSLIYGKDTDEIDGFIDWIQSNAFELYDDIRPYIDLDDNGGVYMITDDNGTCMKAYDIYNSYFG
jgi:hypothetical protein